MTDRFERQASTSTPPLAQKLHEAETKLFQPGEVSKLDAFIQEKRQSNWGADHAPAIYKRKEHGLPYTVQDNGNGEYAIWTRQKLGEGGQKHVKGALLVKFDEQGKPVVDKAAKISTKTTQEKPTLDPDWVAEQSRLMEVKHLPNVVQTFGSATIDRGHGETKHVLLQRRYGGDLEKLARVPASEKTSDIRKNLMMDSVDGLSNLHRTGVIHQDIKPGNVFWAKDEHGRAGAHIGDLGLSTHAKETSADSLLRGTPLYFSPERARAALHDEKPTWSARQAKADDVYAMGVTLHQVRHGKLPPHLADKPVNGRGVDFSSRFDEAEMRTLNFHPDQARPNSTDWVLRKMMHPDPAQRPTADEAKTLLRNASSGDGGHAPAFGEQVAMKEDAGSAQSIVERPNKKIRV